MPLYPHKCMFCLAEDTVYRKIVDRDLPLACPKCSNQTVRILCAPYVRPEIQPYVSPNGKYITSRAERVEDLKNSNATAWEPGIEDDIRRRRQDLEEKAFAPIAAGVDAAVASMVASRKLET